MIATLVFGTAAALITPFYILIRSEQVTDTNIPVKIDWFIKAGIIIIAEYEELLYAGANK